MNDDERELDDIGLQLRSAMPPSQDRELKTDLWPRMLRRMEEAPVRFGWFESVVLALTLMTFAVFPELIPVLLYHL